MKSVTTIAALLAAATTTFAAPSEAVFQRSTSLPAVTVQGNAFFTGSTRFYIRGIDYQPGGSSKLVDPMADTTTCTRDIAEFKKLGINTVRVYTVDNSANHDTCMQALADAGIYLVLDVNSPNYSLNRADPNPSYNAVYLQNVFATIDAFASYSNTLAFFSGNEVINDDTTTAAAPYVKAVTRDMRQYIGSRGHRKIPVGYSAADVSQNRMEMAHYMNCGTDDERSDFFAFNDYSWCDPSSFTISGWDQKVKNFTGYGIPIFLSEYGCTKSTRTWEETAALYNSEMTSVYSGGLGYEYSEEGNGFGMVTINSDATITEGPSFGTLLTALKNNPAPSGDGGYSSTGGSVACPPQSADWNVTSDALPAIPKGAETYMTNGAGQGVGLSGKGSQNSGGASSGTATAGSGTVTATSTSSHKSEGGALGPMDRTPLIVGAVAVCLTIFSSMGFGTVFIL